MLKIGEILPKIDEEKSQVKKFNLKCEKEIIKKQVSIEKCFFRYKTKNT